MTLKKAIKNATRIEVMIHVQDGVSHIARISKKDALEATRRYWNNLPRDYAWENEDGSIIAMFMADGALSVGR